MDLHACMRQVGGRWRWEVTCGWLVGWREMEVGTWLVGPVTRGWLVGWYLGSQYIYIYTRRAGHRIVYFVATSFNRPIFMGVFDFLVSASLAYEPGCGQPEPSSTHTILLFDFFSPLSQVEFIFVFDMLQRRME
jgi:hypothetical protein